MLPAITAIVLVAAAMFAAGCGGTGVVSQADNVPESLGDSGAPDGGHNDAGPDAGRADWICGDAGGAKYGAEARGAVLAGTFTGCSEATPQDCANAGPNACCYFYAPSAIYLCVSR